MYLVTSPDNVLLGARETLREARQLVTTHALAHKDGKDVTDADLLVVADPARWNLLLSRYGVERLFPVGRDHA